MVASRQTELLVGLAAVADGRSDKGRSHGYWQVYDLLFAGRTIDIILEIGVHMGDSLAVWKDAFPAAEVHGVDFAQFGPIPDGVVFHGGNAYAESMVASVPDCDVIIDDGSHLLADQQFVAARYVSKLAPGGVLIIEDVPTVEAALLVAKAVPEPFRPGMFVVDCSVGPGLAADSRMVVVQREP